jgi:hypothetical protein
MRTHTIVIAFTMAACGKPAPGPQAPGNDTAAEEGAAVPAAVTDGALWTCQIEDYDAQPCKFHKEADGWHVSKLMGSQRFTGLVVFTAEGMALAGEFFCPWGECTEQFNTVLTPGEGSFEGVVDESQVRVWWDDTNARDFGGAGYGALTGREI